MRNRPNRPLPVYISHVPPVKDIRVRHRNPPPPDWNAKLPTPVVTRPLRRRTMHKSSGRDFLVDLGARRTIMETLAIVHLRNSLTVKQTSDALEEIGIPTNEAEVVGILSELFRVGDMRLRVQREDGPGDYFDPLSDRLCLFYWSKTDLAIPYISKIFEELGYEAGNDEVRESLERQGLRPMVDREWDARADILCEYTNDLGAGDDWQLQRLLERGYNVTDVDVAAFWEANGEEIEDQDGLEEEGSVVEIT